MSNNIDNKKIVFNRLINNINIIENFNENELKIKIENELKNKNTDYKEIREINNREKNDRLIRVLNNKLNKYNIIFQELKVNKKVSIDLQDKIKELLQLHEDLINSNNILEEDENLELFKICYSLEKKKNIIIKSKEDETILSENDEYNRDFYIIPSQLNDIIFINKNNNKPIKNI